MAVAAAAALFVLGTGMQCPGTPPGEPGIVLLPGSVYVRATTGMQVTGVDPFERDIRYAIDWGDGTVDTTVGKPSGDTAEFLHRWEAAGEYRVRVMALVHDATELASDWCDAVAATVLDNGIPSVTGFTLPARIAPDIYTRFRATGEDPDGDSILFQFDMGGSGSWGGPVPSGGTFTDSHRFIGTGMVEVRCRVRDVKGSESDWTEPFRVRVGEAGAVRWQWSAGAPMTGSVLVLGPRGELVYVTAGSRLYAVDAATGMAVDSTIEPAGGEFGQPAYCTATGHVIVGSESGVLRAFTPSLVPVWQWPDSASGAARGVLAIDGDRVYCSHGPDSICSLTDAGDEAEPGIVFRLPSAGEPVVVDAAGYVYVAALDTLYRLSPGLFSIVWRVRPASAGSTLEVLGAGAGNVVYCVTDQGELAVVGQDGDTRWTRQLEDADPIWVVAGSDALFAVAAERLSSLSPVDGGVNWTTELVRGSCAGSCPVLTANGYIYCQDRDEVVYCIRQSDGRRVWSCPCADYLAPGPAGPRFSDRTPATTVTGTGDAIVAAGDRLYCVAGSEGDRLAAAPWPKWQHDTHNTGKLLE